MVQRLAMKANHLDLGEARVAGHKLEVRPIFAPVDGRDLHHIRRMLHPFHGRAKEPIDVLLEDVSIGLERIVVDRQRSIRGNGLLDPREPGPFDR
jgi:hypothetical protein